MDVISARALPNPNDAFRKMKFIGIPCSILISVALFSLSRAESEPAGQPAKAKRRLVLCNDGGSLGAPDMEAPIGIEGLVHEAIDPLRDTMVDTLYWQIGVDPWLGTDTHRLSD
jgi:hypothetical protein